VGWVGFGHHREALEGGERDVGDEFVL